MLINQTISPVFAGIRFDASSRAIGLDEKFFTPTTILSALLPYLLVFAGLILLIMIIISGFQMLTGVTDPKAQEEAKKRLTAAIIGFILLFVSYWLIQILQVILGVDILGTQ